MRTSHFDPHKYLEFTNLDKAAMVAEAVISKGIDITDTYDRWRNVGFALAHSLQEEGRSVFHQISSLYPGYSPEECDRQYDACMKERPGSAITLATFFHMAENIAQVRVGDVMKEKREMLNKNTRSATCAIAPSRQMHSNNSINNSIYADSQTVSKNQELQWRNGAMAQVALPVKTFDTGYTFSDKIDAAHLVPFLQRFMQMYDDVVSRDKMILGALNVVSGLLGACNGTDEEPSGIFGIYSQQKVFAPLYNIIYANAGSGKGDLNFCRLLVKPLKDEMLRQYAVQKAEYERRLAAWEAGRKKKGKAQPDAAAERPEEPVYRTPFTPGNSSSSAVYRAVCDNGGWALMFETEADSVSNMLKTEHGDYSDLLRKAYHHETLSMSRVTERLHIDIDKPRLSVLLTCTPGQIPTLIGDVENGLASRFFFYRLPDTEPVFKNVFACGEKPLDDEYLEMGGELKRLVDELRGRKQPLQFVMSDAQQREFLEVFKAELEDKTQMLGNEYQAFVFRLGLGCFRYAMTLTALRLLARETPLQPDEVALPCDDRDFHTAMAIVYALLCHSAKVYAKLDKENDNPLADKGVSLTVKQKAVYDRLPDGPFKTSEFHKIALSVGMPRRTSQRLLSLFSNDWGIVVPKWRGFYIKASALARQEQAESPSASGN